MAARIGGKPERGGGWAVSQAKARKHFRAREWGRGPRRNQIHKAVCLFFWRFSVLARVGKLGSGARDEEGCSSTSQQSIGVWWGSCMGAKERQLSPAPRQAGGGLDRLVTAGMQGILSGDRGPDSRLGLQRMAAGVDTEKLRGRTASRQELGVGRRWAG